MKIAVLTSGGVDSSLALRLLHEQGHDVTAFYLKIWLEEELSFLGDATGCPWEEDLSYVRALCKQLNVPLKIVSLQKEYCDEVVAYTIAQVKAGKTPNPDILCNQRIKFGAFFNKIDLNEYEKVATGHYARVEKGQNGYILKTTSDPVKDQTYFLSHLNQKQLSRALFPIGHLTKRQVRELAEKYDLSSKNRKDSQGICFLGKIKFKEFLRHHLGTKPGDIVEIETNKVIGSHEGFWYHTIGQRKGLGLSGGPWYVVKKDADENIVYVSNKYDEPEKPRNHFFVENLHWISGEMPKKRDFRVKIRHGEVFYDSVLGLGPGGADENGGTGVEDTGVVDTGVVTIDGRDQGIAAGQFAVFYDRDMCLGCGVIAQK